MVKVNFEYGRTTDLTTRDHSSKQPTHKKIIHIDMDCFYAAVEIKHNPKLRGRPIAVGGRPEERSVICTASYEARKYGVKAAISSYRALKLCPHLILIPPDFEKYQAESEAIHEIFERFTPKIEPLSLDEAYLDVSENQAFKGSAFLTAQEIRRLIFKERKLTASAGIAENKFLAKIASDWKKPNGQFLITPQMAPSFIDQLAIEKFPGVGKVTSKKLYSLGIKNGSDLKKYSEHELRNMLGSFGDHLYLLCRGIDEREVETSNERKSLTVEYTYPKDLITLAECEEKLAIIFKDFEERFLDYEENMKEYNYAPLIKGLVVKLKFHDFKSTTLERFTNVKFPSLEQYYLLLKEAFLRYQKPVRLIGLGVRLKPAPGGGRQLEIWK